MVTIWQERPCKECSIAAVQHDAQPVLSNEERRMTELSEGFRTVHIRSLVGWLFTHRCCQAWELKAEIRTHCMQAAHSFVLQQKLKLLSRVASITQKSMSHLLDEPSDPKVQLWHWMHERLVNGT